MLAVPHLGTDRLWLNGLYDAVCIIVLFPLVVAAGAGGKVTDRVSKKVCGFLGDTSYPLYITHYPFVYIYTAWVIDTRPAWPEALGYGALVYGGSILLAWLCLRLYDEPVRGWLKRRFMQRKPGAGVILSHGTTPAGVAFSCRQFDFSVSFSCTSYASAIRSRG